MWCHWTLYPVHGNADRGPLGFRLGDPAELSFAGDFMRSLNGQHGIMELQPGQVNWGEVNPQPYPGAVRLWLMRSFATEARASSARTATASRSPARRCTITASSAPMA